MDKQTELVTKIVQVIKQLRLQQGLTLEELADRAGIHRTTIGLLERGERLPTMQIVVQLAEALGQKLSILISEAEEPGGAQKEKKDIEALSQYAKREMDSAHFSDEAYLKTLTGLTLSQLKTAIEASYTTLDIIDFQLTSRNLPPIERLVELANFSSMIGNILGSELASTSNGLYKRNKPHTYPDLIPLKKPAREIEIKVALETNKPKGHLPKAGTYMTFRYVLGGRSGDFSRGKLNRGDTAWIWEVRVGNLSLNDFALSNTAGDSGKTAVIKTASLYQMKVVYRNTKLNPHTRLLG